MGSRLPRLSPETLARELRAVAPEPLGAPVLAALTAHYDELLRWNPKLSLVGPGTADEIVERHYGESLAALPLLDDTDRTLLDLGSGGGFPGFVLAVARPGLEVVLAEARQRKWAFLRTAIRAASVVHGFSCRCLDARVRSPLPEGWPEHLDVVTVRAVRCDPALLSTIERRSPGVRFLLWSGEQTPDLPAGWTVGRQRALGGARRIVEVLTPNPTR